MTELRIAWRVLRRLLRALGVRLQRWGGVLIAAAEPQQGAGAGAQGSGERGYLHIVAPADRPDAPASPARGAPRQGGERVARLVRTERGSMPQQSTALPATSVPNKAQAALPPRPKAPVGGAARAQLPAAQRLASGASRSRPGVAGSPQYARPASQPRSGPAAPPADWLARVERAAPQDWIDRVARSASLPRSRSERFSQRMVRVLSSALPRLRNAGAAVRVAPGRRKAADNPALARAPLKAHNAGASAVSPDPAAPPVPLARAHRGPDRLGQAPHRPAPQGGDGPWPGPPRVGEALPAAGPDWPQAQSILRSRCVPGPLTGPWPPLPPSEPEPERETAAAALREHERLRRIDLEQRGIGWNAWLS